MKPRRWGGEEGDVHKVNVKRSCKGVNSTKTSEKDPSNKAHLSIRHLVLAHTLHYSSWVIRASAYVRAYIPTE